MKSLVGPQGQKRKTKEITISWASIPRLSQAKDMSQKSKCYLYCFQIVTLLVSIR